MTAAVEALGARYRLALVTNGGSANQRDKLARLGLVSAIPTVVIPAEVGVGKPDPRIFTLALEQVGCAPEDALMIGDNLERDIAPARALGLATAWIDRRRTGRVGDATYAAPSIPALMAQLR